MNRLVLIDGNAILHRAYHALPPLTDPEGNIINAVYGFISMLLKIIHDLAPSHVAVAFDRPKPTFRKELFKEYQAKRPKMDETLVPQVEKVHEVLRAFNIPIYEMDGFEADDVIGTIVEKVKKDTQILRYTDTQENNKNTDIPVSEYPDIQMIIVTGDRDILQLVEEGKVYVWMPTKGLSEAKLYGEKEVEEKMGVKPKQIPDLKALAGDPSDNYPGVEGIGPKTAVKLLEEFGSVEELYRKGEKGDWGNTGNTVAEKLKKDKENALLSHQLATIRTDVPVDITFVPLETLDTPQAREALEKLGFKSLLKRLSGEEKKVKMSQKEKKDPEGPEENNSEQLPLV